MIPVYRIRELAKKEGYGFNHYEHPLGEATKVVLVGERHGIYRDCTFQSSLIELLEPEVVMHEFYEQDGSQSKSETIRITVDWINRWESRYGIKLRPCDLPIEEARQYEQTFYDFLRGLSEFDDESDISSILVDDNTITEMIMGKLIRAEAVKTDKPLIAIVGGYHVRPESKIHEELRCQRAIEIGYRTPIGYVTVNQDDRVDRILQDAAKFFE